MSELSCTGCGQSELTTPRDLATRLCVNCRDALGVVALPPRRRPAAPCTRCNALKFIRALPRELAPRDDRPHGTVASPMAVTYEYAGIDRGWIDRTKLIDAREAYGVLEMYICTKCGLVEWYCCDVDAIPIGPQYMTEAIDYERDTPYR